MKQHKVKVFCVLNTGHMQVYTCGCEVSTWIWERCQGPWRGENFRNCVKLNLVLRLKIDEDEVEVQKLRSRPIPSSGNITVRLSASAGRVWMWQIAREGTSCAPETSTENAILQKVYQNAKSNKYSLKNVVVGKTSFKF